MYTCLNTIGSKHLSILFAFLTDPDVAPLPVPRDHARRNMGMEVGSCCGGAERRRGGARWAWAWTRLYPPPPLPQIGIGFDEADTAHVVVEDMQARGGGGLTSAEKSGRGPGLE
jgi:hypothetical protein